MSSDEIRIEKVGSTVFELPPRYQIIKIIGKGTYGVVCSARDLERNCNVAIKKIENVFSNATEAKRALRETKLMRHFNHENVIRILDIFKPRCYDQFNDLYLVYELMEADLSHIIASPQPLSDDHIQVFVYQALVGLQYVHSANVLHRDLKPSNLLVNSDCSLKIADFGLARYQEDGLLHMTEYVATRWYRAPEVILSWQKYTNAIDVWSIGCILAELHLRQPIFQGRDFMHQIKRITDVLGSPSERDLQSINNPHSREFLLGLGHKDRVPFSTFLPKANPLACDLMERMLRLNPQDRISVAEALAHPYFADLHNNQPPVPSAAIFHDFDFEKAGPLSQNDLRQLLWDEMVMFHPEANEEERNRRAMQQQFQQHFG
eukprot:CAMPEP_0201511140 /NCGR_PEP_ID=MMETSP0161_2-20130828/3631_1 /ASSEMBLY_ACC=CAM_ASM_000251 /TAXON_ID=180227 /ORGANISM="Neoparamoeba aestuarina, Strain SoJaBio B1-5/56/2" /LENGTH=375 /DNA_ID=CAMNT_0047906503 /DNA_START=84 /DNA_END=1211 /DNA_ORIENTATION=+